MHEQRLLLVRPDRRVQRLEPGQEIRHMPQQRARRQAHPAIGPLALERPHRTPMPVHLYQPRQPHAQSVARAPEQRRLQRRDDLRCRLALLPRALATRPVAGPPDAAHVPLDLNLDPLMPLLAVAAVGPPAVRTLARASLRFVHLLPHPQARVIHPGMRDRSRLPPRAAVSASRPGPPPARSAPPARPRCRPGPGSCSSRSAS